MKNLISVPPGVVPHFHKFSGLSEADWFVGSDPASARVGSGGGTSWLLSECWNKENNSGFNTWLREEKRIIIHAGGQGRRLPAYAPFGKSLLPMPVFRWSRGQDLNQRLIHLQTPLFEKILENAPGELNTLIASGDTLIFQGKRLPEIPQADVVCFGLWLEPEKATRHGVFFTSFRNPGQLKFMLQKPSTEKIQELVQHYYFLMDIGIWLFSPKAVNILMKKCGWDGQKYQKGIPDDYDMYSTFGAALGENPLLFDPEIRELKVAVVNLEGGEFYHLGNTSELITSNLAIQNRVTSQREIWHKYIKPHPSVFVLNAEINNRFTSENQNIWVENAFIPDTWSLTRNHCLTGIPENNWTLNLKKDNCLDMVPLDDNRYAIRNYGFRDKFSGRAGNSGTTFMGQPIMQWLESHGIKNEVFHDDLDIQNAPLFPVLHRTEISEGFLQWLLEDKPVNNKEFVDCWLQAERFSAAEISEKVNLLLSEKQRQQNRLNNILQIAKNYRQSVFFQLDLKRLSAEYLTHNFPLPEIKEDPENVWVSVHKSIFRASYRGTDGKEDELKAFSLLKENILERFRKNPVEPCIDLLPDQIAWGRSPVRLDIAGGWTDTPPYCILYGGKVVNIAVELNGQPPLHCYIRAIEKPEFVLRSIDLGDRVQISSFDELLSFQNIKSPFSIPGTALALSGFHPDFSRIKYVSLQQQLKALGNGLEISVLSAVPKGSGLGTSSILAATILGTLSNVCRLNWDKMEIGSRVLALEQLLTTGGGWQDQYGGLLEGVKFLETAPGNDQEPTVKWLPDSLFTSPETKKRMLLYYTGITRVAKNILADIVRGMFLNSSTHLSILEDLKQHAESTSEIILKKDYEFLGQQVQKSWILNQKLDEGTNTPEIQKIIEKIEPHIIGQKLLGAGGGGFMLIFAKDEMAALKIKKILADFPPNPRARFLDFEISQKGFQVTRS